ncbi:DUF4145 domain-containing protein [Enterococcus termitis]|uniref:DUF4145 domain-containing protein n=1 Tax=Enterococcus termitis TaxID=332950 RepID=UPI00091512BD|nr:DUF4145 domain-containing protein [Enterococcus termitis]OJG96699.1 hypothetical protein RV18_GL001985 [Enterococcus termitis]
MKVKVPVYYNSSTTASEATFDLPNKCPHCGETIFPRAYKGVSEQSYGEDKKTVAISAQCSNDSCKKYFIAAYNYNSYTEISEYIPYSYRPPIKVELPENIEKVSPNFVEIYSQATTAESEKLNQIAGVGYRKALEFLVKDYAIRYNPDETEKIKTMLLGPVIKQYLSDFKKLQTLATAATWIGNDETHYVRRHEDKDIKSMKRFIRAAAQYIAAEYDTEDATDFTEERA